MLTLASQIDAERLIEKGEKELRLFIKPNKFNKFQLYLTGKVRKGVEIIGVRLSSMRAYYSLIEYSTLVGIALEKRYRVFIKKDGPLFKESDWFLVFNKGKNKL